MYVKFLKLAGGPVFHFPVNSATFAPRFAGRDPGRRVHYQKTDHEAKK
jgi:hypothetical protein